MSFFICFFINPAYILYIVHLHDSIQRESEREREREREEERERGNELDDEWGRGRKGEKDKRVLRVKH